MNSLIVFTTEDAWHPTKWFKAMDASESDTGQFVVERTGSWISLLKRDDLFYDYDDNEKQTVQSLLEVSKSYLVEWKGDVLLDSFIKAFPPSGNVVIDNDHGLICSILEVQKSPICRWIREPMLVS